MGAVLWVFLLCLLNSASWAANESDQLYTAGNVDVAPIIVNGEVLFEVIGIRAFPAKERADRVADYVEAIAGDTSINPDGIEVVEHAHLSEIMLGDTRILTVLDADTEYLAIVNRKTVTEAYAIRIREGIVQISELI